MWPIALACGSAPAETIVPPAPRVVTVDVGEGRWCGLAADAKVHCSAWPNAMLDPEPLPGTFVELAVGLHHVVGLRSDGRLAAWGYAEREERTSVPKGVFLDVAAGARHGCAAATGGVRCWGDDTYGQLQAPSERLMAMDADLWRTCGLDEQGSVRCWGLGPALPLGETGGFVEVAVAGTATCALQIDGQVVCDGVASPSWDGALQVEGGAAPGGGWRFCARFAEAARCWGPGGIDPVEGPGGLLDLTVGAESACGVAAAGSVVCWHGGTFSGRPLPRP